MRAAGEGRGGFLEEVMLPCLSKEQPGLGEVWMGSCGWSREPAIRGTNGNAGLESQYTGGARGGRGIEATGVGVLHLLAWIFKWEERTLAEQD